MAIGAAVLGLSGLVATTDVASAAMTGDEITQTVRGKRIYLATPFGGEFPLNYRPNGRVDGDGEALGLGRFVRPQDSGRWWVDGNRLCQQWTTWENGKVFCFTLRRTGPASLFWVRSDGLEGSARIGK
jgi:hypothetical protein